MQNDIASWSPSLRKDHPTLGFGWETWVRSEGKSIKVILLKSWVVILEISMTSMKMVFLIEKNTNIGLFLFFL